MVGTVVVVVVVVGVVVVVVVVGLVVVFAVVGSSVVVAIKKILHEQIYHNYGGNHQKVLGDVTS